MQIVCVPLIVASVYALIELYKTVIAKSNQKLIQIIPVIGLCVGAVLGVVIFYACPSLIAANNLLNAIIIGGASGLSATGCNQLFKQLKKFGVDVQETSSPDGSSAAQESAPSDEQTKGYVNETENAAEQTKGELTETDDEQETALDSEQIFMPVDEWAKYEMNEAETFNAPIDEQTKDVATQTKTDAPSDEQTKGYVNETENADEPETETDDTGDKSEPASATSAQEGDVKNVAIEIVQSANGQMEIMPLETAEHDNNEN